MGIVQFCMFMTRATKQKKTSAKYLTANTEASRLLGEG